MQPLCLIGAEHSYFTAKARAYLRWSGLPFVEQIGSKEVYKEIRANVGWSVIPVLRDPNHGSAPTYIQDTSDIIDYCDHTYTSSIQYAALPPTAAARQRLACFCFEIMGDEWLKMAAMHYRWSFPDNLQFLTHEWHRMLMPNTTAEQLPEVNKQMQQSMKTMSGALPPLGVTPDTIPGIESTYREFLSLFEEHLKHYPFLLGGRPCLADFALMGPLYAHLSRDPVPGAMMKSLAPRVAEWVDRCNQRTSNVRTGFGDDLLPGDEVPETVWPMLALWHREHASILARTADLVADMVKGGIVELPRAVGSLEFEIGGAKGRRAAFSFDVWMLQRLLREVERSPRNTVEEFFARLADDGLSPLLKIDAVKCRVHRRRGQQSKFGQNLFSGDGEEPAWARGTSSSKL